MNKQAFDAVLVNATACLLKVAMNKQAVGAAATRLAKMLATKTRLVNPALNVPTNVTRQARQIAQAKSNAGWLNSPTVVKDVVKGKLPIAFGGQSVKTTNDIVNAAGKRNINQNNWASDLLHRYRQRLTTTVSKTDPAVIAATNRTAILDKAKSEAEQQLLSLPSNSLAAYTPWANKARIAAEDRVLASQRAIRDAVNMRYKVLDEAVNRRGSYADLAQAVKTRQAARAARKPTQASDRALTAKTHGIDMRLLFDQQPLRISQANQDSLARLTSTLPTGKAVRYKGFTGENRNFLANTAPGRPIWVSPRPDVAAMYANAANPVAVLDEAALRTFGPLGPMTKHVATDTRGYGRLKTLRTNLGGRRAGSSAVGDAKNYEQVATMPERSKFIDAAKFYVPRDGQYQSIASRGLFGK